MKKTDSLDTIVFIGSYPPRECGIATFTFDLLRAFKVIAGVNVDFKVCAMNATDEDLYDYPTEVAWQINQENTDDYILLAQTLNDDPTIKTVVIQHEYGIYGSGWGKNLLEFVSLCKKPITICMHTVLEDMDSEMKKVTQNLLRNVDNIVVLTNTSKNILESHFSDLTKKISVIEHGIHPVIFSLPEKNKAKHRLSGKTVITTFGLLSRGKGIEYVIRALPTVVDKYPDVVYLILGQTHPVERRREGESYRLELIKLIRELKLTKHIKFYDKFLDIKDLLSYLSATDIYISTSLNPQQAVSGTLSYALGSGRAVITTDFKQAKEVVDETVGIVVPPQDSDAYSHAILSLLSNREKLNHMHKNAFEKTRSMLYTNVAHDYLSLIQETTSVSNSVLLPPLSLKHLQKMTDDFGLLQFAKYSFPDPEYGYTLDDNARALIACKKILYIDPTNKIARNHLQKYLNFMFYCLQEGGTVVNYLNYLDLHPTKQNSSEDIQDSYGRAMWSLAEIINSQTDKTLVKKASRLWYDSASKIKTLTHLRAIAFSIKALSLFGKQFENEIQELANKLVKEYKDSSSKTWSWFENSLTYCNGILPEALLCAYETTSNTNYLEIGLDSLNFLVSKTFMSDVYVPIGQKGWHQREGIRNQFDQQPEDPTSMIQCLTKAYALTHDARYKDLTLKCFSWFLGNNLIGARVYNDATGGCHDALTQEGINLNQGAESLISYLLSYCEVFHLLNADN